MNDTHTNERERSDFIKEMYRVYWANIARSMEGIWKILAPITVVGTIIVGVHKDYLPPSLGISFAFIVIFWALNMTVDLNAWHRRNLFFMTKAEQEFLIPEDYGRLLPSKYRIPQKGWITFYKINAIIFIVLLLLCVLYAEFCSCRFSLSSKVSLPSVFLLLGIIITLLNFYLQEKSAKSHFKELFQDSTHKNNQIEAQVPLGEQ